MFFFFFQSYIFSDEANLANYDHACFDKAMAEIVNKAITTTLLLQLIINELILLIKTLLDGKISSPNRFPSNRISSL